MLATENTVSTCYACANPATSTEHVPPKCLFPELKDLPEGVDLRRNLITVPSCKEHNLRKSGDDEYLLHVLTFNLPANPTAEGQLMTKIFRAMKRRPALSESILRTQQPALVIDERMFEIYETAQIELDGARFEGGLNLIARGIYFHHYRTRWNGNLRVCPEFIRFPFAGNASEINADFAAIAACAEQLFAGAEYHGENPEVFSYQVCEPGYRYRCLLRLSFYGGCKATAFFETDPGVIP
jgi:hypothetical protein